MYVVLAALALSLTHLDPPGADRTWTMFHGQLLEVLYASPRESLAIGTRAIYRIDASGRVLASNTAIHGYGASLRGNPEKGTFALDWPEGEPHYDWIHRCNIVLHSLRVVPTNFYEAYAVGPEGALVTRIKQGALSEFNYPHDEVVMIDPVTGKVRWRVDGATDARFVKVGVEVFRRKRWELRDAKSGKLIRRSAK